MHRARMLPINTNPNYDWYRPRVRFARVPRSSLDLLGDFESKITPLAVHAAAKCGQELVLDDFTVIMPVHELQVANILAKFSEVEMLHPDISVEALGQSSIRCALSFYQQLRS